MTLLSLAMLACAPEVSSPDDSAAASDSPVESAADSPGDSTPDSPGDSTPDSPDDTAVSPGQRCPPEMAPITDAGGVVRVCVDRWETVVEGVLGDRDQFTEGAVVTAATTRSAAGQLASTGVSFGQARQACANSPVLDEAGETVGYKHLIRSNEWEDAADGVWGEGGSRYTWGDTWEDGVCNLPDTTGQPTQADELPTGSLPECVSAFGVWDLLGNLWEWADPEWQCSVADFLTNAAPYGAAVNDDDSITWGEVLDGVAFEVPGVDRTSLERGEDGRLRAWADPETRPYEDRSALGYLILQDSAAGPEDFLPVLVMPEGDPDLPGPALLYVAWQYDGQPLTDKRGCAWYVGGSCTTDADFHGHTHDFEGSIGVRCAAAPY